MKKYMKRRKLQIKNIKRKYRRVLRCYLRTKLNFNSQYVRRLTHDEMFKVLHKTGGSYDFWINFTADTLKTIAAL